MKPIRFKQVNIVLAENQPQYQPLPVQFNDELEEQPMTSCWELDEAELAQIIKSKKIYLKQLTFGNPFQPIHPTIYNPFEVIELAYFVEGHFTTLLLPLQDGTHQQFDGLTFEAALEALLAEHLNLKAENFYCYKIEPPAARNGK